MTEPHAGDVPKTKNSKDNKREMKRANSIELAEPPVAEDTKKTSKTHKREIKKKDSMELAEPPAVDIKDKNSHKREIKRTNSTDLQDIGLSTCVICQHDFKEPKILPCLHTFCKKCLRNLRLKSDDKRHVLCPECHDPEPIRTDINKLPDNTLIQHLKSLISLSAQSHKCKEPLHDVICSSCDVGNIAVCRCVDCKEFLCAQCVDSHKSMKALRSHHTLTMKEWHKRRQDSLIKPQIAKFCTKHKGEEICSYCIKCRVACCKDCVDLEHVGTTHECISLEEAVQKSRQSIEDALENNRQIEAKFRGAWEILDKRTLKLKDTVDNLRKQIQDVMIREREEIEKREEAFLTDLKSVDGEKRKEMDSYFDILEINLEDFWSAQDLADSVLDIGNDLHVISLEQVLCERLELLATKRPTLPSGDIAEIDFVEEDDEDETEESDDSHLKEDEADVDKWQMESVIGGRGSAEGQFDWCRGVTVCTEGHIVVADWGNHRVQVFDKDGKFHCVLNNSEPTTIHGRLSMPLDVACLLDGRIATIDKSKYVRVFDPDGKYLYRFETVTEGNKNRGEEVELSCVTVDRRSRIFVGDVKRNVVTVHYTDGMLIKTIPTVGPAHIAITSRDHVVVSCTQKQKVRVMNFEGKFNFQMDVYGDGEKLRPRGVGCDENDNIYVVHKERGGEKTVHMYDAKGKYVECVATNLNEPYDVELSPDGRVVVSDDDSVRIFRKC